MAAKMIRTVIVDYDPNKVKAARHAAKLTIRSAALLAGMNYVTLANIEAGCRTSEETLQKLSAVYSVPIQEFLKSPLFCEQT